MRVTKQQILFGLLATLLMIIAAILYVINRGNNGELVEIAGAPREEWPRKISTESDERTVLLVNSYDGYSIRLPDTWGIPETASAESGLKATYHRDGRFATDIDFSYGLELSIIAKRIPLDATLEEWLTNAYGPMLLSESTVGTYRALKTSRPLLEYNAFLEKVPRENSLVNQFFVRDGDQVFFLACTASGPDYQELVDLCINELDSFQILK